MVTVHILKMAKTVFKNGGNYICKIAGTNWIVLCAGPSVHTDPAGKEQPGSGCWGPAQHQGEGREQQEPGFHQYRVRSEKFLYLTS